MKSQKRTPEISPGQTPEIQPLPGKPEYPEEAPDTEPEIVPEAEPETEPDEIPTEIPEPDKPGQPSPLLPEGRT